MVVITCGTTEPSHSGNGRRARSSWNTQVRAVVVAGERSSRGGHRNRAVAFWWRHRPKTKKRGQPPSFLRKVARVCGQGLESPASSVDADTEAGHTLRKVYWLARKRPLPTPICPMARAVEALARCCDALHDAQTQAPADAAGNGTFLLHQVALAGLLHGRCAPQRSLVVSNSSQVTAAVASSRAHSHAF